MELIWAGSDPNDWKKRELSIKSQNLLKLFQIQNQMGFKVLDFFIIPIDFYRDYFRRNSLEERIKVNSVDDLTKMNNEQKRGFVFSPSFVPDLVLHSFDDFFNTYRTILEPAINQLSGSSSNKRLREVLDKKYKYFDLHLKKCRTSLDVDALIQQLEKEDPVFKKVLEIYLSSKEECLMYRSGSLLQDNPYSFAGVFESYSGNSENKEILIRNVLSSSFSPFAQFYMDKHNIMQRELECIIQRYAQGRFWGIIEVEENIVSIKYSQGISGISDFHVKVKNGVIIKYRGYNKTVEIVRESNPFDSNSVSTIEVLPAEKLSKNKLLEIAQIGTETCKVLNYQKGRLEFLASEEGPLNLVELKPLEDKTATLANPLKPQISKSKLITKAYSSTIGECRGFFFNLVAGYNSSSTHKKNISQRFDTIQEIDRTNPGAIYLIDPLNFFIDVSVLEEAEKRFYMLTPNKKGIIVYNSNSTWEHMDAIYRAEKVFLARINDMRLSNPILKLPDKTIINIWSSKYDSYVYLD